MDSDTNCLKFKGAKDVVQSLSEISHSAYMHAYMYACVYLCLLTYVCLYISVFAIDAVCVSQIDSLHPFSLV